MRIWHGQTYRLENTLNYGLERVWAMSCRKGGNDVAFGFDEGTVCIKLGREAPVVSMDANGKIVFARHNEIHAANVKTKLDAAPKDGEPLSLPTKDQGASDIYPSALTHSPNGRFVAVLGGDGEYVIMTALAWRNKAFGSGLGFVWSQDSNR